MKKTKKQKPTQNDEPIEFRMMTIREAFNLFVKPTDEYQSLSEKRENQTITEGEFEKEANDLIKKQIVESKLENEHDRKTDYVGALKMGENI